MANWLDLEMGADLTGWMEFGDQGPKRMTMLNEDVPLLPAPKTEGPRDPVEEKVTATCSEKTEGLSER